MSIDWSQRQTQEEVLQEEETAQTETAYQDVIQQIEKITIDFMGYTFSGSQSSQSFIVTMITKIEGSSSQSTRNVYTTDRIKVPMTRAEMIEYMDLVDIQQEIITDA